MLYLILAIFSSAAVALVMRLSTSRVKGGMSLLCMNYITCTIAAGVYTGPGNLFPAHPGLWQTVGLGVFNGALYLGAFLLLQRNTRRNGVVLSSVFMRLGLLVPMVLSVLVFRERPGAVQVLGFVLAVGAIVLINAPGTGEKQHFRWGLLLLLLAGGGADAMSKVFEQLGSGELSSHFLYYTFQSAMLFCAVLVIKERETVTWREVLFGLGLGLPNYFSTRFLLLSLSHIPAVIAYPTYSVATILAVTLAGVAFFRERLQKNQWAALGIILVALVLLNV